MSFASKVLAKDDHGRSQADSKGGEDPPIRYALREAWDAVKHDDFDGFAEAFTAALDIQRSEEG